MRKPPAIGAGAFCPSVEIEPTGAGLHVIDTRYNTAGERCGELEFISVDCKDFGEAQRTHKGSVACMGAKPDPEVYVTHARCVSVEVLCDCERVAKIEALYRSGTSYDVEHVDGDVSEKCDGGHTSNPSGSRRVLGKRTSFNGVPLTTLRTQGIYIYYIKK